MTDATRDVTRGPAMAATALPTPAEFERLLASFINTTLLGGAGAVGRDTRLFEEGYINSLRILDLIAVVEKTLGRRIPDRAVRLANFRTIATVVAAFHPDGATDAAPTATPDRLFEHPRARERFASPLDALTGRGELVVTAPGQVSLSGLPLAVIDAVERTVVAWGHALGAVEHAYPAVIDAAVLERAGQANAPATVIVSNDATEERARRALAPAVCYHAYPEWAGRAIGPEQVVIGARGHCYRHEGGTYLPLERLWEFSMREIIVLGTRDQVEEVRQGLVRQVSDFVTTVGLDATIDLAADPFFAAGDEGRRLMQQAGALKYELRLAVDATGHRVAAASFNHHHDFFGRRFGITLADGSAAHSGCVAFGLERWALVLLAQHGIDESAWPDAARQWLRA